MVYDSVHWSWELEKSLGDCEICSNYIVTAADIIKPLNIIRVEITEIVEHITDTSCTSKEDARKEDVDFINVVTENLSDRHIHCTRWRTTGPAACS